MWTYVLTLQGQWAKQTKESIIYHMTRDVAYATRYGHITLNEALDCDAAYLRSLIGCWSDIVAEENGK